jgi:hypothetical protein
MVELKDKSHMTVAKLRLLQLRELKDVSAIEPESPSVRSL